MRLQFRSVSFEPNRIKMKLVPGEFIRLCGSPEAETQAMLIKAISFPHSLVHYAQLHDDLINVSFHFISFMGISF